MGDKAFLWGEEVVFGLHTLGGSPRWAQRTVSSQQEEAAKGTDELKPRSPGAASLRCSFRDTGMPWDSRRVV